MGSKLKSYVARSTLAIVANIIELYWQLDMVGWWLVVVGGLVGFQISRHKNHTKKITQKTDGM